MPQQRSNKSQTPINSDAFNLTPDLATLSDTLGVIVPVADQAEGDTVAAARAAAGWPVSDARPLYVYNIATNRIEIKLTGGWTEFRGPLGLLKRSYDSTTSVGLGGTGIICNLLSSVTVVAGRTYKISYDTNIVCAGEAHMAIAFIFKKSATSDATAAGTEIAPSAVLYTAPQAGNGRTLQTWRTWKPTVTETVNIKMILQRVAGANLYDISERVLIIEDMGSMA